MTIKIFSEKRQFPRRKFEHKVGVLWQGDYALAQAGTIGEGGLSFYYPKKIEQGQLVLISVEVPDGVITAIRAEVRNHGIGEEAGILHGLRFLSLSFQDKRKIRGFVAARSLKTT